MMLKSTIGGLIVAATMFAVGPSEAAYGVCSTSTCGPWETAGQFSGTGWNMVPCNTVLPTAITWQQYISGGYAPPVR